MGKTGSEHNSNMKLVSYLHHENEQLAFLVDGLLYDCDLMNPELPGYHGYVAELLGGSFSAYAANRRSYQAE